MASMHAELDRALARAKAAQETCGHIARNPVGEIIAAALILGINLLGRIVEIRVCGWPNRTHEGDA